MPCPKAVRRRKEYRLLLFCLSCFPLRPPCFVEFFHSFIFRNLLFAHPDQCAHVSHCGLWDAWATSWLDEYYAFRTYVLQYEEKGKEISAWQCINQGRDKAAGWRTDRGYSIIGIDKEIFPKPQLLITFPRRGRRAKKAGRKVRDPTLAFCVVCGVSDHPVVGRVPTNKILAHSQGCMLWMRSCQTKKKSNKEIQKK